jgi:signal transduction histidine kinase
MCARKTSEEDQVRRPSPDFTEEQIAMLRAQSLNLVTILGAGIAHDINNLMGSAVAQAELMKNELDQQPSLNKERLNLLQQTLLVAGGLTDRLMAVGRRAVSVPTVDLASHLQGMRSLLRASLPKAHELVLDFPAGAFPVACDPSQIDQLILNLFLNARDALGDNGRIRIALVHRGQSAEINVEDNGTGIPPEVLPRIFEPFYSTKAFGSGTGLGLSAVKVLAESLGGTLQVSTTSQRGSCFTISLPIEIPHGASAPLAQLKASREQ